MTNTPITPAASIHRAAEIGKTAGLKYIYCGNLPGDAGENTLCDRAAHPDRRSGFAVERMDLKASACPHCGAPCTASFDKDDMMDEPDAVFWSGGHGSGMTQANLIAGRLEAKASRRSWTTKPPVRSTRSPSTAWGGPDLVPADDWDRAREVLSRSYEEGELPGS